MKRGFSGIVLGLALVAAACSGGGESDSGAPRFLSLGSAPAGGAFFPVGGAIVEALESRSDQFNWSATNEATKGTQENIRRLVKGELDIAMANAAISYFAARGESGWDKAYPIRSVMTLAPNVAMFIAREDSGVSRIPDLAGKRVVCGPAGAGFEMFIGPLIEAHGVSFDDMSPLNATQSGAVDMLKDGSASAAFLGGAVPTGSITQAATSMDIQFVPFDEATRQQLIENYPFFRPATVPAGTYAGQDEEIAALDVGSMHLITSADADEELIYNITKTIYELREQITATHRAGKAINPKNVVRDTGVEFHPGAERFYREIGIWPES